MADKRRLILVNSIIEDGLKVSASLQEIAAAMSELKRQLKHCRARWIQGLISSPGEEEKPSGFCSEPADHEGDHIFPNNNRQPQRDTKGSKS